MKEVEHREFMHTLLRLVHKLKDAGEKEGTVPCPHCGGGLHYSTARNGHMSGRCETQDCLEFTE